MSVASATLRSITSSDAPLGVMALEDAHQIDALREAWTDLLLRTTAPTVFHSWEWMAAWRQTRASGGRPCVLVARAPADGMLVGLAPLIRPAPRPFGLRALRCMGTGVGADHLGFLVASGVEDRVHHALVRHLLADPSWDTLELSPVGEELASRLVDAVRADDRYGLSVTVADICPFLSLPSTWADYERLIGSNRRKQLARRWRRLHEQGAVTIERVEDTASLDAAWPALLDLHSARREAVGRASVFVTPDGNEFHARFVRLALERGWLRLYLMRVDGRPVAAEYGLSVRDRVTSFQGGFDAAWARFGVGGLLVAHAIKEAITAGAVEFDFLRGTEAYKAELGATQQRKDMSVTVWRRRPRVNLLVGARRYVRAVRARLRSR